MKTLFILFISVICGALFSQTYTVNQNGPYTSVQLNTPQGINRIIPSSFSEGMNQMKTSQSESGLSSLLFNWTLQFTASGKVFKDVSFANTQVGYVVTELGSVYKTTNGGVNWVSVMSLGFPYYWYGVQALSVDTVVIAGFNNQDSIRRGALRWSFNGGASWSADVVLQRPTNGVGWLDRVHFYNQNTGIVFNGLSGACYTTSTGGKTTGAWNFVQADPSLGWFAGNYTNLNNGTVYATGISLCKSTDYGATWVAGPPADGTFDGGVDFLQQNAQLGWTGGGAISPNVMGWTHQTTDGGTSWSGRQMLFPYPVRGVKFFNSTTGFAIGGNVYSEGGFIYSTSNGGTNWNLEVSTAAEMFSLDFKSVSPDSMDVWVVGSTGGSTGFIGKVYKARMQNLVGIAPVSSEIPSSFRLFQNYPNPFNPTTKIGFSLPKFSDGGIAAAMLIVYNVTGREVRRFNYGNLNPGTYEITFDASNLSTGVYFYKLGVGDYSDVKKMIVVK